MKAGKTLNEIAAELTRQAQSKRDYLADTRKLSAVPTDGGFLLDGLNGGALLVRDTAHEQVAQTLGIPKVYYDRLRQQAPDLLARNVNHWLHEQPQRRMIRTLDGGVRAFLSDRYRPLDNLDLAEAVLPKLNDLSARVESAEVTDRRFYLKVVTDRIQGEVKPGDIVQAGIVVSNSEVGMGSLKIEEMSFRLVCVNGAIHAAAVRKTHVGRAGGNGHDLLEEAQEFYRDETRIADDRAFFLKVQDATAMMFDGARFQRRIEQYKEAGERRIEADPVAVVEVTAKRLGLLEQERSSVLQHLIRGGDLSQFGLANAVTRASQDVADYARATELEALGGSVFELPPREWEALAVPVLRVTLVAPE